MSKLTESPAWQALAAHQQAIASLHMRDLFTQDSHRFEQFSLRFGDILFDFSKNRITQQTLPLLIDLANQAALTDKIEAMFNGLTINTTENRAVLHTALRNRSPHPVIVNGQDVMPDIKRVLAKMRQFSTQVRSGNWKGYTGKAITDIVNIGIGGSDLGPKVVVETLAPYTSPDLRTHFVSNIDASDLVDTLKMLNPETTLFLIASKSFSTLETMTNAHSARNWFLASAKDEAAIARHFVAISTNEASVIAFGIDPVNMFEFWDWVGGRYSLWSAIGLSIALSIGMDHFEDLLKGAHKADQHFRTTPFAENIPVIMALLGIWYNNFFKVESYAVLPYAESMAHFPAFLQQTDMESNGKNVDLEGNPVDYSTGPILWGKAGTNGQHAFYQLIHQGTKLIPCDFLAPAISQTPLGDHNEIVISNFLAQTEALMKGKTLAEARAELHSQGLEGNQLERIAAAKVFEGNRPSNSFLFKSITPEILGTIIAFYEHKIFVQSVIWNINAFDQMGVELGKVLANVIMPELEDDQLIDTHDSSTNALINSFKQFRKTA